MRLKFVMIGVMAAVLAACGNEGAKTAPKAEVKAGLNGAGSSFIAPLFSKWAAEYNKSSGVAINYQSVGSGAGIDQIKKKTVDFGATDAPMKAEELTAEGLVQFPSAIGGVVAVYNIKDLAQPLVFNGQVLGDIYLGKIKKWNDPAIVALNKDAKLPDMDIKVVRRSDGSGTTFLFTEFLAKTNADWGKVGANKSPAWVEGTIGGKGNEGVATNVKQFDGSIGYVEYIYAKKNNMASASMVNKDGKVVTPSAESFAAAAAKADWKVPGMAASLTYAAGEQSWPIAGTAFVLMHAKQDNPDNAAKILKFFDWGLTQGNAVATELEYIPLPAEVVALVKAEWKKITDASGKAIMP
ncbi:MAG: phosphate ABC transporter substrate-binding protein PstS [Formosimonas sp.]